MLPKRQLEILAATLLLVAASYPGNLRADEPSLAALKGFGAVEFGAHVEVVKEKLPAMKPVGSGDHLRAAAFNSPHLARFIIDGHKIEGIPSPVQVELRFWRDQLWGFLVYFERQDTAAALAHLEAKYGKHTTGVADRPIWKDGRVTLQAVSKAGWYGVTSDAISEDARGWFFKSLTGSAPADATSAEAAPLAATPAPDAATPAPDAPAAAVPPTQAPSKAATPAS